jgi:hypothetical protein
VLGIKDDWPSLGRNDRMLNGQEKTRFGGFFVASISAEKRQGKYWSSCVECAF